MKKITMLLLATGALLAHSASLLAIAKPLAYTLTPNTTLSIFDAAGAEAGYAGLPDLGASVVFTKDGKTAWVTGNPQTFGVLYAINVATKTVEATLGVGATSAPLISPDGSRLVVATGLGLTVVDAIEQQVLFSIATGSIQSLSFAANPQSVYAANGNNLLSVNLVTGQVTNLYAISAIEEIAVLPDNETAAIRVVTNQTDGSGPILRLNLATGTTTTILNNPYQSFILSANGKKIFALFESDLTLIDIASGSVKQKSYSPSLKSLCASPSGAKLYGATANGLTTIDLLSLNTPPVVTTAGASPSACAVTPDSTRVWMTSSTHNAIGVFNTATQTVAGVIEAPAGAAQMVITPDGTELFVASTPVAGGLSQLTVLDTATGRPVAQNLGLSPRAMAISHDGTKLVVGNNLNGVWNLAAVDVASLTITAIVPSPLDNIVDIVFSPDDTKYYIDGQALAAGNASVAAIDSGTNQEIRLNFIVGAREFLCLSPDASTLYLGAGFGNNGPNSILVINAATLKETFSDNAVLPTKGLILSKDGSTIFAIQGTVGQRSFTLTALNTSTLSVTGTLTFNGRVDDYNPQLLSLSPDDTQIYVSDTVQTYIVNSSNLSVISISNSPSISPYLFGPQ